VEGMKLVDISGKNDKEKTNELPQNGKEKPSTLKVEIAVENLKRTNHQVFIKRILN
jgi:hypothetical protein